MPTAAQLQEKFSVGGKVLNYGGLDSFYGGLEKKVGTPKPNA